MEFTKIADKICNSSVYQGSKSVLFIVILFCALKFTSLIGDTNVPVTVNRRLNGDIYYTNFNSTDPSACSDDNNLTFLVSERRCVKNQELFDACNFSVSPIMEPSTLRVALALGHHQTSTDSEVETIANTFTTTHNSLVTNAVIIAINNVSQSVNGSLCQITSLEVYRGRRHITQISHNGFFLSDEGALKLNQNKQAYNTNEYEGELYRMNISCTAERLLKSGCFYFKVIGTTNIKSAKFNLTVQGTVGNDIETVDSKTSDGLKTTDALAAHGFRVGTIPFYMVIGIGSAVAIVTLITIVILMIYVSFHITLKFSLPSGQRKRKINNSNLKEAAQSANVSILSDVGLDSLTNLGENLRVRYPELCDPKEKSPPLRSASPALTPLSDPKEILSPLRSISPALTPLSNQKEISSSKSISPALTQLSKDHDEACYGSDMSLSPRKCDQIPVYIFLGPKESDQPFPKSPVECTQNLAYLHLGPEESSTSAPLQLKPITCKQNAAYIDLDPQETST